MYLVTSKKKLKKSSCKLQFLLSLHKRVQHEHDVQVDEHQIDDVEVICLVIGAETLCGDIEQTVEDHAERHNQLDEEDLHLRMACYPTSP